MKTKLWLSFLTLTNVAINTQAAQSQTYQPTNRSPVSDNTLGTQITGNGNNFNITGGINRGQTLFHSFTDFYVPTNGQANFLNPVNNRDIITRVTGNLFSDINGTVNTNGANLFLINPNGIVFGTNAQLNVGKAFVGSTANSIDLVSAGGRINFGTNSNGDAPLLSVAPNVLFDVSRLNIGGGNGAISNFGTLQTNNPSQYIGLIGGNVTLDGSAGGGKIIAPGGRVDIGGLKSAGTVSIDNNGLVFNSNGLGRSNVLLTNGSGLIVRATGILDTVNTFFNNTTAPGGSININTNNLDILNSGAKSNTQSAAIDAGLELNLGVQTKVAGDINIDTTGKINLNNSDIKNTLRPGSEGSIGGIKIQTGTLDLNNNSIVSTAIGGKGTAGNVIVTAKDTVSLVGKSGIYSGVLVGGVGNGGNINIKSGSLSITNGAELESSTYGMGNAGNISLMTKGAISLNGTYILSAVETGGVGNGGSIDINAGALSLKDGAQLTTVTRGKGNSGDIIVNARKQLLVDGSNGIFGSGIFANVEDSGIGKGGDIKIDTESFSVTNAAVVISSSRGQGNAGNIQINAFDFAGITGNNPNTGYSSGVFTFTQPNSTGTGGNITVNTNTLRVSEGGVIDARTRNNRQGGEITVKANVVELLNGGQIVTTTSGSGFAGKIDINASNQVIINGIDNTFNNRVKKTGKDPFINIDSASGFFVRSTNTGRAGDIQVNSPQFALDNGGTINAESISGSGGNINITKANLLLLRRGANITTNAGGTAQQGGNGGNINIDSNLIIAIPKENSDISANAVKGQGGNVNINSQGLFGIQFQSQATANSDITASSSFGQSGNVDIKTPGTDPGKDSTELPKVTTDASKQISQVCSASNRQNKLTVTGRGGLPPNANEPLTSDAVWQDARAASSQPAVSSAISNPAKLAAPAVGWVFDGKGKVTLVAAATQGQPTGTSVACPKIE